MENTTTIKDGGITYSFSKKVKSKSRNIIQNIFSELRQKSWKNSAFFDDLEILVYGRWGETCNTKNISPFNEGFVNYPVVDESKKITLRTKRNFLSDSIMALIFPVMGKNKLKTVAIHELGHLFDFNFATPDPDLVSKMKEFIKSTDDISSLDNNKEFAPLAKQYCLSNGLSDSDKFNDAWRKDVELAFKGHSVKSNNKLIDKLGYYSPVNFDDCDNPLIRLDDGIDDEEIEYADRARQEVFAQLFAYAMGAEDKKSKKNLIVNTYKNSYKVVEQYINEYLGTNTQKQNMIRKKSKFDCSA